MTDALLEESDAWLWRIIDPQAIDPFTGRIKAVAFELRANEEALSVYAASMQTPAGAIQRLIDELAGGLEGRTGRNRERYEQWIQRKGTTVQDRIRMGWRVAKVRVSAFTNKGFQVSNPESDGHISISGTSEQFRRWAPDLAVAAEYVEVV